MNTVSLVCQIFLAVHSVSSLVTDEQYARLPPVFAMDDFDQCMLLGKEALYCKIDFYLEPLDSKNISDTWKNIEELKKNPKNYYHDFLRHGVCVPMTCPTVSRTSPDSLEFKDELAKCYSQKYKHLGLHGTIKHMYCQTNEPRPYDTLDKCFILFITLYVMFVIYASFYEGLARYKTKEEYDQITGTFCGKIISCFSIPRNFFRLRTINDSPEAKPLKAIQGVRFFNMALVISSHTSMISYLGPVGNTKAVELLFDETISVIFMAGGACTQTFFLIAAWLLTYNIWVLLEKKDRLDKKTMFWIFINRYLRLTPTLMVIIGFNATLLAHLTKGPFWDNIVGIESSSCRENGWTNILYLNNYVNNNRMCTPQTWFLAADMHLFILALFILAVMKKYPKHIKLILGTCFIVAYAIPGIVAYVYNFKIVIESYPEPLYYCLQKVEAWHIMFSQSHSNIGAYIMGMIFGYVFYQYRNSKFVPTKMQTVPFYLFTYGLGFFMLVSAYPFYETGAVFSRLQSAIYWSSQRNIFVFAVGILIFGFTREIGWFGYWLCCWNPVQILGRLTFCSYLIHTSLQRMRQSLIRQPMFVDKYLLVENTIGDIAVTYLIAFFVCLIFEMPISALQKLLLSPKQANEQKETKTESPKNLKEKKSDSKK